MEKEEATAIGNHVISANNYRLSITRRDRVCFVSTISQSIIIKIPNFKNNIDIPYFDVLLCLKARGFWISLSRFSLSSTNLKTHYLLRAIPKSINRSMESINESSLASSRGLYLQRRTRIWNLAFSCAPRYDRNKIEINRKTLIFWNCYYFWFASYVFLGFRHPIFVSLSDTFKF